MMKLILKQFATLGLLGIAIGFLFNGHLVEAWIVIALQLLNLQIVLKD